MKTKRYLLASSPTLEGLTEMICQFYGGEKYHISWGKSVCQESTNRIMKNVAVRKLKGRYRFEAIEYISLVT
jgi:hypothetical protein